MPQAFITFGNTALLISLQLIFSTLYWVSFLWFDVRFEVAVIFFSYFFVFISNFNNILQFLKVVHACALIVYISDTTAYFYD